LPGNPAAFLTVKMKDNDWPDTLYNSLFYCNKLTVEFPVSSLSDESSRSEVDKLEIQSLEIDQKILVLP
jgi:hypothetical protein